MSNLCLLDTHVLLWAVSEPQRLRKGTRSLIENNQYAVSVASLWELVNKRHRPDAPVLNPIAWWERYVVGVRTPVYSIRPAHVMELERLPLLHKDPYDRILIAQSVVEQMPLVTGDSAIQRYAIGWQLA
jgi:PIN domain nuclease of toxin-antitoxin system